MFCVWPGTDIAVWRRGREAGSPFGASGERPRRARRSGVCGYCGVRTAPEAGGGTRTLTDGLEGRRAAVTPRPRNPEDATGARGPPARRRGVPDGDPGAASRGAVSWTLECPGLRQLESGSCDSTLTRVVYYQSFGLSGAAQMVVIGDEGVEVLAQLEGRGEMDRVERAKRGIERRGGRTLADGR